MLSYLINYLRVHAIVVTLWVVQTAIIQRDFHSIIHKEAIFVWIIDEKGWVCKSLRNRFFEMR